MINSPLNYSGNKFKVLKEILPKIPEDITTIVEIFSGSALVSLNSNAKNLILNDQSKHLLKLLQYFKENDSEKIIKDMEKIIDKYGFTNTYKYGNKHYEEKKHEGLSLYNKEPFQQLKKDYNIKPSVDKLFALIIYDFNHYLRFNRDGLFNVPVGKVDYSESLRKKTVEYVEAFKTKNVTLKNQDFREKDLYQPTKNTLYYFDPPYLITNAPYNAFWNEKDEIDLLNILDELNEKNIKFALSNVMKSNGLENKLLMEWSKKYYVYDIKRQYRNANYRRKNITETMEVLITNYERDSYDVRK